MDDFPNRLKTADPDVSEQAFEYLLARFRIIAKYTLGDLDIVDDIA